MPANHFFENNPDRAQEIREKAWAVTRELGTKKSLTDVGKAALDYTRNPQNYPSDTPDPRQDAQGFASFIKKLLGG